MAVFPGSIYSQLPQYHDGRAPAREEPRDERMVGVHGDRGRNDVDREIPVLGRVGGSTRNAGNWKILFTGRRVTTDVPIVTNLRLDPFECFHVDSGMYERWWG